MSVKMTWKGTTDGWKSLVAANLIYMRWDDDNVASKCDRSLVDEFFLNDVCESLQ